MSITIDQPPAIGTYGRVLRRYDLDPSTARRRFVTYAVHLISLRCELGGRVAFTLFFPDNHKGEAAAHRATRLGWADETEAWRREYHSEEVRSRPAPRVVEEPVPEPEPEPELDEDTAAEIRERVGAMSWTELGAAMAEEGLRSRKTRRSMERALTGRREAKALASRLHDPAVEALADEFLGPDDGPPPQSAIDLPIPDTEAYMDPTDPARHVPQKTGAVQHGVRNMEWRALREKAKELGVPANGDRRTMEDRVISKLSEG